MPYKHKHLKLQRNSRNFPFFLNTFLYIWRNSQFLSLSHCTLNYGSMQIYWTDSRNRFSQIRTHFIQIPLYTHQATSAFLALSRPAFELFMSSSFWELFPNPSNQTFNSKAGQTRQMLQQSTAVLSQQIVADHVIM